MATKKFTEAEINELITYIENLRDGKISTIDGMPNEDIIALNKKIISLLSHKNDANNNLRIRKLHTKRDWLLKKGSLFSVLGFSAFMGATGLTAGLIEGASAGIVSTSTFATAMNLGGIAAGASLLASIGYIQAKKLITRAYYKSKFKTKDKDLLDETAEFGLTKAFTKGKNKGKSLIDLIKETDAEIRKTKESMTSANFFKKIGLFAKMTYLNIKNRNRLHFVMDEQARIDALLKKYPENSSLLAKKEVITDYERDFIFDELISALKTKKFENLDILTRGLDLSDIKELLSKYELTSTKTEKGKGLLLKTLERSIARTESIAPVVIPGPDVHKFKRRTEIVPDLVDPDSDKKPDTDPKPEDKPEKKPEDKPAVIETFGKDDYVTYIIRDGESVETVCTFYCRKNIKGQFNLFDIQIDPATNSASYNGRPCVIIADNIRKKATIQFADGSTETIISQAIKTTIDGVVKQLEFLTTKPQLFAKAKRSRFLKKGVEPQGIYSDKTIESLISAYYDSIMSVSNPQVTGAVKNLHFDVQRAIDEVHLTGPKTPESSTT